MADFRLIYEALEKRHALPPYEEMAGEFDLDIPEKAQQPMREIAKRIFERADGFRKVLEALLHPESVIEMQEAETLTDEERRQASDVLQRLVKIDRALLLAEIDNTEGAYAAFARDAVPAWLALKPELRRIVQAMNRAWGKRRDVREMLHYFG